MGLHRRSAAEALRTRWASRAARVLGQAPALWATPACHALAEAVTARRDPVPALRRYAHHRADVGFTLPETIEDLDVLGALDQQARQALDRRAVGLALGEVFRRTEPSVCVDPLTMLPNGAYLEVRVAELRRAIVELGADGETALGLVCLSLPRAATFERAAAQALTSAEVLRHTYDRGETVAALSMRVLVVLVVLLAGHHEAIATDGLPPGTAVWLERVPPDDLALAELLDELALR